MTQPIASDVIEVWRPADLTQLELRRGFAVARPVPRHWHEEYQLCLIQSGSGELIYRRDHHPTPPASLFLVHPGEVHSNRAFANEGCSYRSLYAEPELVRQVMTEMQGKETPLPFFKTAVVFDQGVIGQFLDLYRALEQPASRLERQNLLLNLLTSLLGHWAETRPNPQRLGVARPAVQRAYEYLSEHCTENVSLEQLSAIAHLSPFHFNRMFTAAFGLPPHACQTQLRVFRAKTMLRQGWSPPQVALQTGFVDQSHLTRHFKRLVGIPPGKYLQNSKNVQDLPETVF